MMRAIMQMLFWLLTLMQEQFWPIKNGFVNHALRATSANGTVSIGANHCSARGGCDCDCGWAKSGCGTDDGSCCWGCCCSAPQPSPTPPSPSPGGWAPCSSGPCCNPYSSVKEYCPGHISCQACGGGEACQCPSSPMPTPPPTPPVPPVPSPRRRRSPVPPSPPSPPTPGAPPSDGCFRGKGEWGVALTSQKALAASFWQYQWGAAPYGSPGDIAGVLQIVNGGSKTMWIRYGGNGIGPGESYYWKKFITSPSVLNGNKAHAWNGLNEHGMTGQGDGFKLEPGEYQIVPFASSACWAGASLGCDEFGANCQISPAGRGAGTDASPKGQPNTLFEWTAPGVWDASLVDGFGMPMKVEVDGCGAPFSGSKNNCRGSDSQTWLQLDPYRCPNKILTAWGRYVGCKSMCGCQNAAQEQHADTDPACPGMTSVSSIANQPNAPGGYCGCPQGNCVQWLRNLFARDAAGKTYCDAVTEMTAGSTGKRAVYCQAYDDNAGTRSYGNGVLKVTFCNRGFEYAQPSLNATLAVV